MSRLAGNVVETPLRIAAWLINGVRVNRNEFYEQHGVPMVRKTRRWGGTCAIVIANWFLAWSNSGVRMFVQVKEWTEWEASCTQLLYPDQPAVQIGPGPSVSRIRAEGRSLRQLLDEQILSIEHVAAVARELHRVHQLPCGRFQGGWSHGDLHLDNCLIHPTRGSVVLIDFDICHEPTVAPIDRRADDLRTVLLELLARLQDPWQPFARALLKAYADLAVLSALRENLDVPRGFHRLWWQTKIYGCPMRQLAPRLVMLRAMISDQLGDH